MHIAGSNANLRICLSILNNRYSMFTIYAPISINFLHDLAFTYKLFTSIISLC